jgi:hypothetical protein
MCGCLELHRDFVCTKQSPLTELPPDDEDWAVHNAAFFTGDVRFDRENADTRTGGKNHDRANQKSQVFQRNTFFSKFQ